MREIDANTRAALLGSRPGDELVCWVWYDGALAYESKLPVSSWSLSWDGKEGQKVPGTLQLTIADPEGELSPWVFEDPLGVGGSVIQVSYLVGGANEVKIGWFRITENSSQDQWEFRVIREDGWVQPDASLPNHQRMISVPAGSEVKLTAQDLTEALDADEFLAPEQPPGASPTVQAEIERLVGDTMPVVFQGLTDEALPRTLTWEDNRMEAILDLLDMIGGSFRMGPDGELVCYKKTQEVSFTCQYGPEANWMGLERSHTLNKVANIGVVTSSRETEDSDGRKIEVPIVGSYEVETGPLRVGGPFGRRVVRMANPLMNSQSKADLAAKTLVLNQISSQTVDLDVICLPDPSIEVGDYGIVATPVLDGREAHLRGEVISVSMSGTGLSVSAMKLKVRCLFSDVASALKGISLDRYLTGTKPELTYDNVNPLRTMDQMYLLTEGEYHGY